jgi:peptidoglycan/LPS O-acetylase OafA/YrhL
MVKNIEAHILPQKTDNKKLLALDLLRGITAFAVFMGHLRTLFFVDYSAIKADKIAQVFFFLTGFGHQSVIIFFILSGFFIAKTIQESIDRHKWRFKDYFINRFIRLETVLLPALILGFIYDTIGLHFFAKSESYAGLIPSLRLISPIGKLDLETFFANILFLQNIIADTFGSNAPLWSLANEFWYYMIFPLIYFSLIKKYSPTKRVLSAVLAVSILVFIGQTIALYFLIWLMGAGAFYAHRKYGNKLVSSPFSFKTGLFITFFLLLLILFCTRINYLGAFFNDFSLGFSACLFVFLLSLYDIKTPFLKRLATYLSNISYTLYVTHIPIAMLLCSMLSAHRQAWNYSNLAVFFILAVNLVLYSTLSWYLFERNTAVIKKWFKSVIGY